MDKLIERLIEIGEMKNGEIDDKTLLELKFKYEILTDKFINDNAREDHFSRPNIMYTRDLEYSNFGFRGIELCEALYLSTTKADEEITWNQLLERNINDNLEYICYIIDLVEDGAI